LLPDQPAGLRSASSAAARRLCERSGCAPLRHRQRDDESDRERGRRRNERLVNPCSVDMPAGVAVAATIAAATSAPIAPPTILTIVFIPVATPVCDRGTASTIRFAIEANANAMPTPITNIAR
jgi:hypothetical protein